MGESSLCLAWRRAGWLGGAETRFRDLRTVWLWVAAHMPGECTYPAEHQSGRAELILEWRPPMIPTQAPQDNCAFREWTARTKSGNIPAWLSVRIPIRNSPAGSHPNRHLGSRGDVSAALYPNRMYWRVCLRRQSIIPLFSYFILPPCLMRPSHTAMDDSLSHRDLVLGNNSVALAINVEISQTCLRKALSDARRFLREAVWNI